MNHFLAKNLTCKNSLVYVFVFTCFEVGYIIAECFFRDAFDEYSDNLVIQDQISYSPLWLKFLSFMTSLGYGFPISILVLFYYEVSKNKINAIFLILLITYINYFLSILKMLYHQPRPYMRNIDIIPLYKCGEEWGDPSGHAMTGLTFYFILFNSIRKRLLSIKFQDSKRYKSPEESLSPIKDPIEMKDNIICKSKETMPNECEHKVHKDKICPKCQVNNLKKRIDEENSLCDPCIVTLPEKKHFKINSNKMESVDYFSNFRLNTKVFYFVSNIFCYCFSFALIALIGYSRFFFGLHSLNQVLLGWIYGVGFIVYFYYFLTNKDLIVDRLILFFNNISKYSQSRLRILYSFFITFTLILTFLIPWIIFYVSEDEEINPIYLENMKKKCAQDFLEKNLLFYSNCFSDIGSISIVFGIFYGIILSSGNYAHEEFWPNYYVIPLWKKALRIIFLGAIAGIIFGIFAAINFKNDAYVVCFLNNGLKGIILGVSIVVLIPKIYSKLKLDVRGDFMREREV